MRRPTAEGGRSQYPAISVHWPESPTFDMAPGITVSESDFVVATGEQLHELCEERRILHLLFAGLAANRCIY